MLREIMIALFDRPANAYTCYQPLTFGVIPKP